MPFGTSKKVHKNRPYSGLTYYVTGKSNFVFDNGKRFPVSAGEIIYLPFGSSYRVEEENGAECYCINFLSSSPLLDGPRVFRIKDTAGAERIFHKAATDWRKKQPGYKFRCLSNLYRVIAQLQEENALGYQNSRKLLIIKPGVDVMLEQFTEPLSIGEISALCGISPEYFRSLFKAEYGVSPAKYINNLRLNRAAELMKTELYTVTEAALLSGFDDLSSFSRAFRKSYGVSPKEYIKNYNR